MNVTRDQAAAKGCPIIRIASPHSSDWPASSVQMSSARIGNCVGSRCMMWRWADSEAISVNRRGFCGLAGTPRHDS